MGGGPAQFFPVPVLEFLERELGKIGKNWEKLGKIGNMRKNVIHENLLLLEQTATMEAFECVFFNKCVISVVSIPIRC